MFCSNNLFRVSRDSLCFSTPQLLSLKQVELPYFFKFICVTTTVLATFRCVGFLVEVGDIFNALSHLHIYISF